MKKILLMLAAGLVAAFMLSGCDTDRVHDVSKTAYMGGKAVVAIGGANIDEETLEKLKKIDGYATLYESARTVVKGTKKETEGIYPISKSIYIEGKKVVTLTQEKIPEEILEKMKKADDVVIQYDQVKNIIEDAEKNIKNKKEE